ncbi:MAG: rhamnulokinase [Oscillospiraceae bacterium]|nr:rhamnulokinase [Oscillospiraceae bacterium]
MNKKYYLAVDIGASSGRHMLVWLEDGKLQLEEVYRFANGMVDVDGTKCWEPDRLFAEIKNGMRRCAQLGKIPVSMGVDTWGVDFVLLDAQGNRLGNAVAYRDSRTQGMDAVVESILPQDALYRRTGIQKQMFNTIYQLMAIRDSLKDADAMLLTPDYYHYLLTGKKCAEFTIASTTQLLDTKTGDWDWELLDMLGYPRRLFQPIRMPGTVLGGLTEQIQKEVGFDCQVILPGAHDTASAVLSVPTNEKTVYISSGTWSLMGVELTQANCTEESRCAGFTNEGGYNGRYRYLRNLMGMWMIQSVRKEMNDAYTYPQLCAMAEQEKSFPSRLDVDADVFFAPDNMTAAIREYCRTTGQAVPETPGQLATVIYQSLAENYGRAIEGIERLTGNAYSSVSVVGGGSNADYLNQLTANATGKTVYAGPGEATAIGNALAQMLSTGEFRDVAQARQTVFDSFGVKTFLPA